MKTCISLILTTLFLIAVLTGCSANGNVSTSKDGTVNGGRGSSQSNDSIMDDPGRPGSSISPTTGNSGRTGMGGSNYGNGQSDDGYAGMNGITDNGGTGGMR